MPCVQKNHRSAGAQQRYGHSHRVSQIQPLGIFSVIVVEDQGKLPLAAFCWKPSSTAMRKKKWCKVRPRANHQFDRGVIPAETSPRKEARHAIDWHGNPFALARTSRRPRNYEAVSLNPKWNGLDDLHFNIFLFYNIWNCQKNQQKKISITWHLNHEEFQASTRSDLKLFVCKRFLWLQKLL